MPRPPQTIHEAVRKPPWKPLHLAPAVVEARPLPGGGMLLRSPLELRPYPRCLGEWLRAWAAAPPDRTCLAERDNQDNCGGRGAHRTWRRFSYGAALAAVERIAGALLARGLDRDRPVAILSENGIDNGLLQLAAMHAGIPVVPISPAYSLLSSDHVKLRAILEATRPGLVYAGDGARYAPAFAAARAALPGGVELVVSARPPAGPAASALCAVIAR